MKSTVIISKRGAGYTCDASGRYGGGYQGASAGRTPEDAAAFGAREMLRYAQVNPEGGDLIAPADVLALIPAHLHHIEPRGAGIVCPRCGEPINAAAQLAKIVTPKKAAAARENGKSPCAPGKKRGRPKKINSEVKP